MKVQLQNKPINFRSGSVSKLETVAQKYVNDITSEEIVQRIIHFNREYYAATNESAYKHPILKYITTIMNEVNNINEQFMKNFTEQLNLLQENVKLNNAFKALTEGLLDKESSQAASTRKILKTPLDNGLVKVEVSLADGEVITEIMKRKRSAKIKDRTVGIDEIDSEEFVKKSTKRKPQPKTNSGEPEKELKNPDEQGVKKADDEHVTRSKLYPLVEDAENKTWDQCKKEQKRAEKELKQLSIQVEGLEKRKGFAIENTTSAKEDVKRLKQELIKIEKQLIQEKKKMTKIKQGEYFQNRQLISEKKHEIRAFSKRIKILEGKDYKTLIEEHSKTEPLQEAFDDIRNYNNAHKKWSNKLKKLQLQEKESHQLKNYHKRLSILRNEIKALEEKYPDLKLLNKKIERAKKFADAENEAGAILNSKSPQNFYEQEIDSLQKEIDELQEKFKLNQAILATKKGNPIPVEIDTASESYKIFSDAKAELAELSQKRNSLHFENEQKEFEQLKINYQKLQDQIGQKQQILDENASYNPVSIINNLDNEKISVQNLNAKNGVAFFLKSSKRQQSEILTKTLNEIYSLEKRQQNILQQLQINPSEKLKIKKTEIDSEVNKKQNFIEQIKSLLPEDMAVNFDTDKIILFAKTQNELKALEAELKNINLEKVQEQLNYIERRHQELTSKIEEKVQIVRENKPLEINIAENIDVEKINLHRELINENIKLNYDKRILETKLKTQKTEELSKQYDNILVQIQENEAKLEQNKTDFTNPEEIRQKIVAKEKELNRLITKQLDLQKQDNKIKRFRTYLEQKRAAGFPIRFKVLVDKRDFSLSGIFHRLKNYFGRKKAVAPEGRALGVSFDRIFNKKTLTNNIEKMEKLKEKVIRIQAPFYEKRELISSLSIQQNDTSQRLTSAQKRLVDANIESSSIDKKHVHLKKRLDSLNKRNQNKIKSKENPGEKVEEKAQEIEDDFFERKTGINTRA